jgi:hypothetical protein
MSSKVLEKLQNTSRGIALMELETITVFSTVIDERTSRLKNITAKNVKNISFFI